MNAFKRKSIYLAVAAGLGAVGMAGTATGLPLLQRAWRYGYLRFRG